MSAAASTIGLLILIDDNIIDQKLYKRILMRSGRVDEIIQFHLARDALAYLLEPENGRPDLVLLDINMPQMDGFEFLSAVAEKMGESAPDVVVMLTTSLDPKDQHRAATYEAVKAFLNKPLTPEHVLDLLEILASEQNGQFSDVLAKSTDFLRPGESAV